MKKYIILQNLIAPYRTYLFNELSKRNFNFEIFYMSETEADRNWKTDFSTLKYSYWIDKKGLYWFIKGFHIHINPLLIWKIIKEKRCDIILSVSWNNLNIIVLALFKKTGILKNTIHFWTEANYMTIGASNDNKFKYFLRKFVYSSVDGFFILPGKMAEDTLKRWNIKVKKLLFLPNMIEEENFTLIDSDFEKRKNNLLPICILPVRLIEKIKGVMNFFEAITADNILKSVFFIVGDGCDKSMYEKYIDENNYNNNIKLLGFCDLEKLNHLYAQANLFILPSFSDPSPLALIEAIRMKLPLLISNRCGNHFEALVENGNGYSFDPYNKKSIRTAFEKMFYNKNRWTDFSERSGKLYHQNFDLDSTLNRFLNNLLENGNGNGN